jgi:hypothetical protein
MAKPPATGARNYRLPEGASRSERLLPIYADVLDVLRRCNRATGRYVHMAELAAAVPAELTARLALSYEMTTCLHRLVSAMHRRGFIVSEDVAVGRRGHAAADVAGTLAPSLPLAIDVTRDRVMALLRGATTRLGRPARAVDLVDEAERVGDGMPVAIADVMLALCFHEKVGAVRSTRAVRGDPTGGRRLFLPTDLDPAHYPGPTTLTFLECVYHLVCACWTRSCAAAARAHATDPRPAALHVKPLPVTLTEVRAALLAADPPYPEAYRHQNLAAALKLLERESTARAGFARATPPLTRRVVRPEPCPHAWVPIDVPDGAIERRRLHATDAERLAEAVRRAVERLEQPATVREVAAEIRRDALLLPARRAPLSEMLAAQAARARREEAPNRPLVFIAERLYNVGQITGVSYYVTRDARRWVTWVRVGQLERDWAEAALDAELDALAECPLPTVAAGRAMLVVMDARLHAAALGYGVTAQRVDPATAARAHVLGATAERVAERAAAWLAEHPAIVVPYDVLVGPRGNLASCLDVARAACAAVSGADLPDADLPDALPRRLARLERLIQRQLRRVLDHRKDARQGAICHWHQRHFDHTDVKLLVARTWGGPECCAQAMRAAHHLGRLRDPRFVYPGLRAPDVRHRLAAVACLAYLPSGRGNQRLRRLAIDDPEAGVRQAALWAYAVAGGPDAEALLAERLADDVDARVRRFLHQGQIAHRHRWWAY